MTIAKITIFKFHNFVGSDKGVQLLASNEVEKRLKNDSNLKTFKLKIQNPHRWGYGSLKVMIPIQLWYFTKHQAPSKLLQSLTKCPKALGLGGKKGSRLGLIFTHENDDLSIGHHCFNNFQSLLVC